MKYGVIKIHSQSEINNQTVYTEYTYLHIQVENRAQPHMLQKVQESGKISIVM